MPGWKGVEGQRLVDSLSNPVTWTRSFVLPYRQRTGGYLAAVARTRR